MMTLLDGWLRFGSVVTATGEVLTDKAVRVDDGRIQQIVDGREAGEADIYRPRQTLIPGFVDAHIHLTFGYESTHDVVRRNAETCELQDLARRAGIHASECLRGGTTTARDCGDRGFVTVGVRDAIGMGRIPGPRLLVAGPPITIEHGHLNWCGGAVDGYADIPRAIERLREGRVDFVKLLASGGHMTAESDPLRVQFTQEQIAEIAERAHRVGLPVAVHAHSSVAIKYCAFAAVDSIEHCSWTGPDGSLEVLDDTVEEIVTQGTAVVLTMAGIQRALLPGRLTCDTQRDAAIRSSPTGSLASDFDWARRMLAAGARVIIASDAGVRMTPFVGFVDSVRCGALALGVSAARAIELATLAPARVLGVADEVGSIEVGKSADLVALDGLLTNTTQVIPNVVDVWQAGNLVS